MYIPEREIKVELILKSELYSLDGGVVGILGVGARRDEYRRDCGCEGRIRGDVRSTVRHICKVMNEVLELQNRLESSVNLLPRRVGADGAKIFLPGSAVKGIFRSALDLVGIRKAEVTWGDSVYSTVSVLVDEFKLNEKQAVAASLMSDVSWLLVEWGDATIDGEPVGSVRAVSTRRKVAERICRVRGDDKSCLDRIHRRLFLGLSELVFGTTGLKGAVAFTDFLLVHEEESYIKTYNAVAKQKGKVTVPFKLELLPSGAVFRGSLLIYKTPFISEGEVDEALKLATRVLDYYGEMTVGGRNSVGFGRVKVRLKYV